MRDDGRSWQVGGHSSTTVKLIAQTIWLIYYSLIINEVEEERHESAAKPSISGFGALIGKHL